MRVFVSHAGRDRAWAEWVAWQLEHAGWDITVELDCWDWQAGDNFVAEDEHRARLVRPHAGAVLAGLLRARALDRARSGPRRSGWRRTGRGSWFRFGSTTPRPRRCWRPLIAPALHGRPREQARAELLGALRPAGRPDSRATAARARRARIAEGGAAAAGGAAAGVGAGAGPERGVHRPRRHAGAAAGGAAGLGPVGGARPARRGWGGQDPAGGGVRAAVRRRLRRGVVGQRRAGRPDRRAVRRVRGRVGSGRPGHPGRAGGGGAARGTAAAGAGGWSCWTTPPPPATSQPWRLDGPGHVLVTSRDPRWPEIAAAVPVDVFARAESIALLRAHLPDPARPRMPTGSPTRSGDLPLALAQAAGLLAETGMPRRRVPGAAGRDAGRGARRGRPALLPAVAGEVAARRGRPARRAPIRPPRSCCGCARSWRPNPIPTGWFPAAGPAVLPEPLAATVAAPLAYRRALGALGRYGLVKLERRPPRPCTGSPNACCAPTTPPPTRPTATVGRVLAGLTPGDPRPGDLAGLGRPAAAPAHARPRRHRRRAAGLAGLRGGSLPAACGARPAPATT